MAFFKDGYTLLFFFFNFLLLLLLQLLVVAEGDEALNRPIDELQRSWFPRDFVFGSASSAYQYEGAAFMYGKGPSIWDNYTHQHPERIADGSNGDVALDSYHRYKEDIAVMKQIGFKAYRFSISWPRILPKGKLCWGVNREGIEYYNNLIDELLANGIQPFVTLFHWDVPQALEDEYQGFLSHQIVDDFRDFAEVCFREFGDRVKHWITLNEQYIFTVHGYVEGDFAPGRCSVLQPFDSDSGSCLGGNSAIEPYLVGHNLILAHAAAVKVYKTKYQVRQRGLIGITLVTEWFVPYSPSWEDREATERSIEFSLGWFLRPLVYGDYPPIMRKLVKERLPHFTKEETISIIQSFDFLGLNYYTSSYAKDYNPTPFAPNVNYYTDIRATTTSEDCFGNPIGPRINASSWLADFPRGLKDLLIHIKDRYKNPIIYITENGYFDYDSPDVHELTNDSARIHYYRGHLNYLQEAIREGVRVKGYFAWTLIDNFEWASGYTIRFGLTYVDFKKNLKRIPKASAKWFKNFLCNGRNGHQQFEDY